MLKVNEQKCETCLYRLKYDKQTRDRMKAITEADDTFVACHMHRGAGVVCRGYYDNHYEKQSGCTALQLARRFELLNGDLFIEFVPVPAETLPVNLLGLILNADK